jgi:hypothetical protein
VHPLLLSLYFHRYGRRKEMIRKLDPEAVKNRIRNFREDSQVDLIWRLWYDEAPS